MENPEGNFEKPKRKYKSSPEKRAAALEWYYAHQKQAKERQREWHKKNPDYVKNWLAKKPGYAKRWKKQNKARVEFYKKKSRYKQLGTEAVKIRDKLEEQQDNKCAICKSTSRKALALDHCHKTKEIRGLLCLHCNTGLGHFRDNVDLLWKAIKYLEAPPAKVANEIPVC